MENIKEDLLKALECPVCFHLMEAPITQCCNGHSICHICKPDLRNCPTCRGDLTDIRNKGLEDLCSNAEYPCKYQISGCLRKFLPGSKEEHEKKCRYGPHKCPCYIVKRIDCQWEGPSTELEQHIRNAHKDESLVTVTSGKRSSCNPDYMKSIHSGSWCQFVFTLGRIFVCYSKIIDSFLYECYMFVGAREDNNYKYTVSIRTSDGNDSVTMSLGCPHYEEFIDGDLPNVKCAAFYKEFTKLCVNEEGQLPFEYEILRKWQGKETFKCEISLKLHDPRKVI